ncbi:MAG: cytochrome c biogenesis protein ResB, partial [Mycobacteriales bacterium]
MPIPSLPRPPVLLRAVSFQLRRLWGQLVSMRTALILLFLLAIAAVPGASFPQRNISPAKVDAYYTDHPTLAPILDRLWAFDVFGSPWFAAIYLLLFVSLTGCLVSRMRVHLLPLITGPPPVPAQLAKLPLHATVGSATQDPAELADAVQSRLRGARWRRIRRAVEVNGAVTLSAERGQLRELGNLVFHFALVVVLIGVAVGGLWGWKGGALVVEDSQFCNTVQSYDQFETGHLVAEDSITPFCLSMDDFRARYLPNGQPVNYSAELRYDDNPGAGGEPRTPYTLEVNRPLRMDGAGVFLINHGYAPILRFTDRYGTVFESPTPFLPKDSGLSSEGAVVLPDANQDLANQDPAAADRAPNLQVAFEGVYVPTAPPLPPYVRSLYPTRGNEGITLLGYR